MNVMQEAMAALSSPLRHLAAGGPAASEWVAFAGMMSFPATLLLLEVMRRLLGLAVPPSLRALAVLAAMSGSLAVYVAFRPGGASMKLFGLILAAGLVVWLLSPKWRIARSDERSYAEERRPVLAMWLLALGLVLSCSFVSGSGLERGIADLKQNFTSTFVRG